MATLIKNSFNKWLDYILQITEDIYKAIIGFGTGILFTILGFMGIRYDKNTNNRFDKIEKTLEKVIKSCEDNNSGIKALDSSLYIYDAASGKKLHIASHVVKLRDFNHNDRTAKASVLEEAMESIDKFNSLMKNLKKNERKNNNKNT